MNKKYEAKGLIMSVSRQNIAEDIKLKLHFQRISTMQAEKPLRFLAQNARMNFIQYCIKRGARLSENAEGELNQFIYQESRRTTQSPVSQSIQQEDSKKKLSLLFAHLAAFNFEIGDLSIDPVAPALLIKKLNQINEMTTEDAQGYLHGLIGTQIPGYDSMSTEDFLNQIATRYSNDGLNFHCTLLEHFFQPLDIEDPIETKPLLNYFMPKVFSQQHINTCVIATQMTVVKKLAANFDQLKNALLSKEKVLPQDVINAESLLISIQNEFTDYLSRSTEKNPLELKKIIREYRKQLNVIQKEMERHIASRYDPDFKPYVKVYDNFILSLLYHLISKFIIPAEVKDYFDAIDGEVTKRLNSFQKALATIPALTRNSICVKSLITDRSRKEIMSLFLNGNSACYIETLGVGHQLVMNIDEGGRLKLIEHKNGYPEETVLSTGILSTIGFKNYHESAEEVLSSINTNLERLNTERDRILQLDIPKPTDITTQKELSDLLSAKDEEIRILSEIRDTIQQAHTHTPANSTNIKKSLQRIKEEDEPKPNPLSSAP